MDKSGEWEYLYERASMHGVLPLIYKTFTHEGVAVSQKDLMSFKSETYNIARENMIKSAWLIKIMELFLYHGIKSTAFKGPTLSELLYGDVITRHYADLDILVDENSLYSAAVLLLEHGFEPTFPIEFLKNRTYLRIGKDIAFDHKSEYLHVELHWKLFENKFIIKESLFFRRYQMVPIYKKELPTLGDEPLLLYLCVHGSKHFWERLEWIVDLDRFIRSRPHLNWDEIVHEAQEMQAKKLLCFGLQTTHLFYKTPLPQRIYKMIEEDHVSLKLAHQVKMLFLNDKINLHVNRLVNLESLHYLAQLSDKKFGAVRTKMKAYFEIKESDILVVNLPHTLSWAYYVIRPFRLAWKFMRYRG
jgi:hypothetical protein